MSAKELRFGDDARHALVRGASVLVRAVKATLGPRGRNVVKQRSFGGPTITKDGVSMAKDRTRRSLRKHGRADGKRGVPQGRTGSIQDDRIRCADLRLVSAVRDFGKQCQQHESEQSGYILASM